MSVTQRLGLWVHGLGVRLVEQTLCQNRLRRLKHVLHMPTVQVPRCALFYETGNDQKMVRVGQLMPRQNL